MSNDSISQPAARTFTVRDLVSETLRGRIRIPEFQRPLRWQWQDVQRLLDSIVKGYPIGNLLLWSRPAPAEEIKLGALNISAPTLQEGWWVVDGQQRLTSLANALTDINTSDDRFKLAYDLNASSFVRPDKRDNGFIIPLPVIFDLQKLIHWFSKKHPEASDKLDEASRITRAIREYNVPAYIVSQDDENILRDIFDRMNNYGKRLSLAEVFSALHPGHTPEKEPYSQLKRLSESINSARGFGMIDDDTILRALLARRGSDITRDIRKEFSERPNEKRDFIDEKPADAYQKTEYALMEAVSFLQEDARVPHFGFLAYRYLLVVLTRFFAHHPKPHSRNRELLSRWYWRAAMLGPAPFSSSWNSAARMLSSRITAEDENGSVRRLLEAPIEKSSNFPKLTGFRTNKAPSRIVMSALWDLQPCSLITGNVYSRKDLTNALAHETSLADIAMRISRSESDDSNSWAGNRMIVLENQNRDEEEKLPDSLKNTLISLSINSSFSEKSLARVLESHALNQKILVSLAMDDRKTFLNDRQQKMRSIVKKFLEHMTGIYLEDTPPLDSLDHDDDEDRDDAFI